MQAEFERLELHEINEIKHFVEATFRKTPKHELLKRLSSASLKAVERDLRGADKF